MGHEAQILPHLHEVLVLCSSCFEKVNTEASRIGLIKRKLHPPSAELFQTTQDMANLVLLQFRVLSKLFKLILSFGKRYINTSYSITLYLNMGRLMNAEYELNDLFKSSKELLISANFLRIQNVFKVVWCAKVIRRKFMIQKERKLKAKKLKEQEKELLAYNMMNNN